MSIGKDPFNVIIGGVGGQGNVLASQILGTMLVSQGDVVTIGETYGASQRGGAVMEGLRILGQYGNPEIVSLINTRPIHPLDVISGQAAYPELSQVIAKVGELSRQLWVLNATEIALEMGDPIFSNIIMLGALSFIDILEVDRKGFEAAIESLLSPDRLSQNLEAFDRGRAAVREV
jgi:indolepyruvate ferredoxin oxidoreductase beta subunit